MNIFRHIPFLKQVLLYTLTAFGGPQGHLGMLLKTFVYKKRYITEEELVEYNSFCQMLPGASSTQLLMLIGYKRGGVFLAIITFIIWVLPACIMMGALSFFLTSFHHQDLNEKLFKYIQPMAVGFLLFAAVNSFSISVKNVITKVIMLISVTLTYLFFKTPWVFPILIIMGGIATNFSDKRIPDYTTVKPRKIRWTNLWLFVFVFIIAGILSESARKKQWEDRKAYNLFENFYRFGSFVFGGGDVLLPMMLDQYVARPTISSRNNKITDQIKVEKSDLLTGYGIVRAIPGPVFSIGSFTGGMALEKEGKHRQLLGCLIGSVAIFLPSVLLVLFFFPVWQNLKKYIVILRALEGINAVVVGVMWAAVIYLIREIPISAGIPTGIMSLVIITTTFLLLRYTKIPAPILVLSTVFFGWIF